MCGVSSHSISRFLFVFLYFSLSPFHAHLSEEFVGRLGSVHLEGRHVEVVDEEEHLLSGRWAEQRLPLLLQLGLEHVLVTTARRRQSVCAVSTIYGGLYELNAFFAKRR